MSEILLADDWLNVREEPTLGGKRLGMFRPGASVFVQGEPVEADGLLWRRAGNTGNSTGPHLHFAIRLNPYRRGDGWGGYSDPLPYLPAGSFALPDYVSG